MFMFKSFFNWVLKYRKNYQHIRACTRWVGYESFRRFSDGVWKFEGKFGWIMSFFREKIIFPSAPVPAINNDQSLISKILQTPSVKPNFYSNDNDLTMRWIEKKFQRNWCVIGVECLKSSLCFALRSKWKLALNFYQFTWGYRVHQWVPPSVNNEYTVPQWVTSTVRGGTQIASDTHRWNVYLLVNGALAGKLLVVITKTYSLQSLECLKFQKLLLRFLWSQKGDVRQLEMLYSSVSGAS